jgi:cation-transporting ATPase E
VGDEPTGDWRPTLLALALLAAGILILLTPALRTYFELSPLRPLDCLFVAGATVAWCAGLGAIWRARLFDRFLDLDGGARD